MAKIEFNFPTNKDNAIELILFCNLGHEQKIFVTRLIEDRVLEKVSNGLLRPAKVRDEVEQLFKLHTGVNARLDDFVLYIRGDVPPPQTH